jgi:hypothetical protein
MEGGDLTVTLKIATINYVKWLYATGRQFKL